jgi:hypothetical protein
MEHEAISHHIPNLQSAAVSESLSTGGSKMSRRQRRGAVSLGARLALLMGAFGLVLQLVLAVPQMSAAESSATALAQLSDLTGQEHALCAGVDDHGRDGSGQACPDCTGLCCHLGQLVAAYFPPRPEIIALYQRGSTTLALPPSIETVAPAPCLESRPRGPPSTV